MRSALLAVSLLTASLPLTACTAPQAAERPAAPVRGWRTTAGQPMHLLSSEVRDATCRQVLRLSAGGDRVRLRLSNALGTAPLALSAVTAGLRATGPAHVAGPLRPVTVGGSSAVEIPAGESVTTDPVEVAAVDGADLLVSFAVRGAARLTAHRYGAATGWCSAAGTGDLTAAPEVSTSQGRAGLVVERVDVEGPAGAPPAVVAAGDSLTDAPMLPDAGPRWTEVVAARLSSTPVVNAAIAGNRVLLGNGYGRPLVQRFDEDVLGLPGVGTVVLLAGTNDLSMGIAAERLERELAGLVGRAHARALRVVLVTVPPASRRTASSVAARTQVNDWIRTSRVADVVVDADGVLRDPSGAERLAPQYDSGDGLHLSPAGHRALGDAVAAALGARASAQD
jgi:lysophospholipase L1-like esterase